MSKLELFVVDLDSPFVFGVGRKMDAKETAEAARHGRGADTPMSVMSITSDGLAGVMGKDLARLFANAPKLLALVESIPLDLHPPNPNDEGKDSACRCSQCDLRRAAAALIEEIEGGEG